MKHSDRDSERAEQDLAHLRQLRPDADAGPAAGGGAAPASTGAPAPVGAPPSGPVPPPPAGAPYVQAAPAAPVAGPTAGAAGPAGGTGGFGQPRFSQEPDLDRDAIPRAPAGLSMPVASDEPTGAVVSPAGPLAADLPTPPAMQYPAGPPLGPLPGQHRPPETFQGSGMSGGTATLAPPQPIAAVGTVSTVSGEWVTCPECGESQTIDPAQRRAEDFCQRCDFPLFWARTAVVPLSTDETGASLRRLPGTVGRAATASVACPHCGEPNSPTAIICIRCSQPMVIAMPEPEPEPEPVYVPPPLPEPEPEPGFPLWWVVGASAALVIITIIVAWIALAT